MWPGNPFQHPAWLTAHATVLEPDLLLEYWPDGDTSLTTGHEPGGPMRLLGDRLSDRLDAGPSALSAALSTARQRGQPAVLQRLPMATATRLVTSTPGARIVEVQPSPSVITNGRTWPDYLDGAHARRRRRIARSAELLLQDSDWNFREVAAPGEIGAAVDTLIALHRHRFADRSRSFDGPKATTVTAAAPAMAADDALMVRMLCAGDRPVAAISCLLGSEAMWFHQSGWDPDWAGLNVGRALLADSIRVAHERSLDFHLLTGDHAYKQWWATADRCVATVEVAAR